MNICLISEGYPAPGIPIFTFVEQLVNELVLQGHNVNVIALRWLSDCLFRGRNIPYYREARVGDINIPIYAPMVQSFGFSEKMILWSEDFYSIRVCRTLEKLPQKPDVIYGHFWRNAYFAFPYAKRNNIPTFVASGESKIYFRPSTLRRHDFANYVSGVICVSTKNKDESIEVGLTSEDRCIVIPNAIDNKLFRKTNRQEARMSLGLPIDKFIVAFVGFFKESKGPDRLSEAINSIKEKDVHSLFIGKGTIEPTCDNILFKGCLLHDQIPQYLNAADVFVLPTRAEGCCNAIIEAMACGLPIISSDLPFNWDVLNERNSIMIDPNNVEEIAQAICYLRDNPDVRERMSQECLKTAQNLTIDKRARNIIAFIEERIKQNGN